mmetsp:Transcript_117220/g.365017  ORF Transcript_117220/g.365017 Transcript_117220/m.365017 type:complete len:276 (-) Transcript_117220:430-1257(-)
MASQKTCDAARRRRRSNWPPSHLHGLLAPQRQVPHLPVHEDRLAFGAQPSDKVELVAILAVLDRRLAESLQRGASDKPRSQPLHCQAYQPGQEREDHEGGGEYHVLLDPDPPQHHMRPGDRGGQQAQKGDGVATAEHAAGPVLAKPPPDAPLEPPVLGEEQAAAEPSQERQDEQDAARCCRDEAPGQARHPEAQHFIHAAQWPGVEADRHQHPEEDHGLHHTGDDAHLESPIHLDGHLEDAALQVPPVDPVHEEEGEHRDRQDGGHQDAHAERDE